MIPYPVKIALDGTQGKKKWYPMVLLVPMAKSEIDAIRAIDGQVTKRIFINA